MDLEVQTEHIDLDPAWRDLIERQAARLAARYPEVLRLHVTLRHGGHHQHGLEEAAIVANVEGATLRADKQEEAIRAAIHASFRAIIVELDRHHRERRHVEKSPGARPAGSIKRIFRDGGYGFIHYRPGQDVYFHRAALHKLTFEDLEPGIPVEFEIEEGVKGLQASRVYPAGDRGP